MKALFILTLLALLSIRGFGQITYYYDGSGALNATGNWWTTPGGTGSNPANFTANNQLFEIRNTVSNSGTWTVSGTGSKVVVGNSTVAGVTLTIPILTTITATIDVTAASSGTNTLLIQGSNPTIGTLASGSTVQFDVSGTQSVPAASYGNLIISNTLGAKTATGNIVVNNTLTINSGVTFNLSTFSLSGTFTTSGTGALQTANTSASPLSSGITWLPGVTYNSGSSQTVVAGVYSTLTASNVAKTFSSSGTIAITTTFTPGSVSHVMTGSTISFNGTTMNMPAITGGYANVSIPNSGSTITAAAAIAVNGQITIASGAILNMSTFALTGNISTSGTGTLQTANSTSTPIPVSDTWSFDVVYSRSGTQTIVTGTYASITLTGSGTKTMGGNASLSGSMNVNAGTLAIADTTLSVSQHLTGTGAVSFTSGTLHLGGDFSNSGTLTLGTTSTINYNGTGAQSVRSATYANLQFTNAGVKTFAGGIVITAGRTLLINAGAIVDGGNNQITATGATATITINGTFMTADSAGLTGLTTTAIHSTNTALSAFVTTSHIVFNRVGDQFVTVVAADSVYPNITLSNTGTKTIAANFYVLAGCTLTVDEATTFFMGTRSIQRKGASGTSVFNINGTYRLTLAAGFSGGTTSINATGTQINLGSASVIHYARTTSTQTVSSRSDYVKLRLEGATFTKTMDGPVTVSDSLNIISADLAIASNTLTINGLVGGTLTGSATSNLTIDGTAGNAALTFNQTSATTRTINNFTLNRSNGTTLQTALDIGGVMTLTTGILTLNGQTLALNGTIAAGSGTITGSSTSNITVGGTGALGTLTFTSGLERVKVFTLNRTSGGTATMGSNLRVDSILTLTSGKLILGNVGLDLRGDFSGSPTNCLSTNGFTVISIPSSGGIGTLYFDQTTPGTTNAIDRLSYSRTGQTITLGNELYVKGAITPTAGTLATGGFLRLVSNASGTARINVGSGNYITGNVIVERYIPATARRWRFMSSPVSNGTLEDWRNEIFLTGNNAPNANQSTTVGGNNWGFDATQNNQPSVYSYTESVSGSNSLGWVSVKNSTSSLTNASLTPGVGYRVFIRGDRSSLNRLNDTEPTQNAVTLNLIGPVNMNDISMPVTYTNTGSTLDDGWNLLGNPYPCQYDWNAFWDAGNSGNNGTYYTNISPTVYIFDATSNSYKSYNALANSGTFNGYIASSQGFFIQATAASPAMTFKEQFKSASTPTAMFKAGDEDEFRIRMEKNAITYDDYILKLVAGSSVVHDAYDINKMTNAEANIASYGSDQVMHTLDARPPGNGNDTIPLYVSGTEGNFVLKMMQIPVLNNRFIFLEDIHLGQIMQISSADTSYAFSISYQEPASYGMNRFRILILTSHLQLPVVLATFHAKKNNQDQVDLTWTTASEKDNHHFAIERSTNGKSYDEIGRVAGAGFSNTARQYTFSDTKPVTTEICYYRLKMVNNDEGYTYSPVRTVRFSEISSTARIYPNPASDIITIESASVQDGTYLVNIYTKDGSEASTIKANASANKITIDISELPHGLYMINAMHQESGDVIQARMMK